MIPENASHFERLLVGHLERAEQAAEAARSLYTEHAESVGIEPDDEVLAEIGGAVEQARAALDRWRAWRDYVAT